MSAQIFPIVGAAPLVLPDPLPTQDVSDGTPGAATPATAIQVAGTDGTNLRTILTDTSGRQEVVGAAASGVAVAGNPVLIGGSDGTDARTLLTDNTGQLKILVENASAIATTDKADGTPGNAVPATALQIAGSDGTDLRVLSTDTTGKLNVIDQHANSNITIPGDAQTIITATTTVGATQTNTSSRGAFIFVTTGTVSGTLPTLQLQIQWSPDGGTTWISLGSTTTTFALVTGNTIAYLVYPVASLSTTTGATQTNDAAFPLPKTWRVAYVTGGTGISIVIASVAVSYLE